MKVIFQVEVRQVHGIQIESEPGIWGEKKENFGLHRMRKHHTKLEI